MEAANYTKQPGWVQCGDRKLPKVLSLEGITCVQGVFGVQNKNYFQDAGNLKNVAVLSIPCDNPPPRFAGALLSAPERQEQHVLFSICLVLFFQRF